ncbi:hypothetical protein GCM10010174_43880 [Kutzneria viridogrisea]|uniref:Uncharacterized protein n=2 Tax=Kutzneria TaxID=43356 RepID=W5W6S1_9PSEU|nr:hypothetical protein [Kutzneria albida]AHH96186.1 hypothetical protein KALB_2818 [Kutzneria albida DSM 43870]MBA8928601.1 hypothetical protein [Kutzneria viridogrisea]
MTGDEEEAEFVADSVAEQTYTVCHHCGGIGEAPLSVLAVLGGVGRSATANRDCRLCSGDGRLAGMVPPV